MRIAEPLSDASRSSQLRVAPTASTLVKASNHLDERRKEDGGDG
jgi:hypothetical protein